MSPQRIQRKRTNGDVEILKAENELLRTEVQMLSVRLAESREANDAQERLDAFDAASTPDATDPGSHSYRKHLTARQADKDTERSLAGYKRAADQRAKLVEDLARALKELRKLQKASPVDPATIPGAVAVQDGFGWHRVVKVNAKTVTVETPWSWTDRIPFSNITGVRHERS